MRHTFCTRLAESGVTPYLLQRYARHSTIELTMKYYVHLNIGLADRKVG
ncbi:MAG: tyrosine-type recombinase/integrase [Pirellulales bacterium]